MYPPATPGLPKNPIKWAFWETLKGFATVRGRCPTARFGTASKNPPPLNRSALELGNLASPHSGLQNAKIHRQIGLPETSK